MSKGSAEENLNSKYVSLFDGSLETAKGITAKLRVKEGAVPKFFKPRPVPFALKDKTTDKLERLERIGVIQKVSYSDWAAPTGPIQKSDGSVRICRDYKITINPALQVQQYLLSTAQELFANWRGGPKFSKLALSTAYQKVELDEASRNQTPKGLYRYARLPYSVVCAPALFQEAMDKILEGLPVGCIIDDIIITRKTEKEHDRNLESTLRCLGAYGLKLNGKNVHGSKTQWSTSRTL